MQLSPGVLAMVSGMHSLNLFDQVDNEQDDEIVHKETDHTQCNYLDGTQLDEHVRETVVSKLEVLLSECSLERDLEFEFRAFSLLLSVI